MNLFRNITIKKKLIFIIMVTSGTSLILASLIFIAIDFIHLRNSIVDELSSQAEILAFNSTAALAFNDKNTANKILSALKYTQSIVTACIFDQEEQVFAVYIRDQPTEELTFPKPEGDGYHFENGHLHLFHRIVLDNENLGTLYIQSDLSQIKTMLKHSFLIGIAVLIMAAVVALVLSHKLQRIISVPIIHLAEIARTISKEKKYSVRAEKQSRDELGDLVEAFNEMLTQIQARDSALRSERDYSTGIITGIPAIICRISPDSTTTFVNPAAEQITGYSAEEHIGQNWWRMHYPGDEYKQVDELFHELRKGNVRDFEMILTTKGGSKRAILWSSINRYDENGHCLEIIGIGNDITERKRAEVELEKHRDHLEDLIAERTIELTMSNEQLQQEITERKRAEQELKKAITGLHQANDDLKKTQTQLVQSEKMASLGMLVAGVAHEINTPIGAVGSMHDTLKRAIEKTKSIINEESSTPYRENSVLLNAYKIIGDANDIIDNGIKRVTTIVRRLRSFARLDRAELTETDIHECLEDTLTLIHHEIKRNIKVIKNYGDITRINCFPSQLNQVFLNILINAKQAIKDKGEITITTYMKNNKLHIAFEDTGTGISKEHIKKIFDPGFTLKGVGVGTGLGLSICYQIIEDHRGEITVESQVGQGSTFTAILPTDIREDDFKSI